jgi:dinuclear metal center YbgI/SA1388 family protein
VNLKAWHLATLFLFGQAGKMNPTVKQILSIIDKDIAPEALAESWDTWGLCAGNPNWPVKKILVGLDPGMLLMEAARAWCADLVLTHHPLVLNPEKNIDFSRMPGSVIAMAAKEEIAVVCAHTSLDKVGNGLNDFFANRLNILCKKALVPEGGGMDHTSSMTGLGRIGTVRSPVPLAQMAAQIKELLGLERVRVVGKPDLMIHQVAVCTGSGGSVLQAFLESGADLYVTGDMKYHDARLVESHGRAMIDVGHFASEIIAVDLLAGRLTQAVSRTGYHLEIKQFTQETDPFTLV